MLEERQEEVGRESQDTQEGKKCGRCDVGTVKGFTLHKSVAVCKP